MEISYRRNHNGNCMVLKKLNTSSDDGYSLKMISRNDIPGLLKTEQETFNGEVCLIYDITSRQSLEKIAETEKMDMKTLNSLFSSLEKCISGLEEYLLSTDGIMLTPQFIFTDRNRDKFYFCFNPYNEGEFQDGMRKLCDRVITFIDYADAGLVKCAYEINMMAQRENLCMSDITALFRDMDKEDIIDMKSMFSGEWKEEIHDERESSDGYDPAEDLFASYMAEQKETEKNNSSEKRISESGFFDKLKIYLKGKKLKEVIDDINNGVIVRKINRCSAAEPSQMQIMNCKPEPAAVPHHQEKHRDPEYDASEHHIRAAQNRVHVNMDLDSDEDDNFMRNMIDADALENGTVMLRDTGQSRRKLIGTGLQQGCVIDIDKYPFSIGKLSREADFVLKEPAVSRLHARLYSDNGYYIEDMNSTNGTYLNGTKMEAYTRQPVHPGDVIAIADQEFIFR